MPTNNMPLLATGFVGGSKIFYLADGTAAAAVTVQNTTKITRIECLGVSWCNEVTDRALYLYLHDGTTLSLLTVVNVPAGTAPATGATAGINLLTHDNMQQYVCVDDYGNKYIDLPPGYRIFAQLGAALTGTNYLGITYRGCVLDVGVQAIVACGVSGKATDVVNADGTSNVDITTTETTPTRLDSLVVTNSDVARVAAVSYHNGSTVSFLAWVPIPQNSGLISTLPAVDILRHANMAPFVQVDAAGNRFMDIGAGHKLQVRMYTAVTAGAYAVRFMARWAQYGAGGTINYDATLPYMVAHKATVVANADGTNVVVSVPSASAGHVRVDSYVVVNNSEAVAKDVVLQLYDGAQNRRIAVVSVPAYSGTSTTVPPVDILRHANLAPYCCSDSAGNKYLELPSGWSLSAAMGSTISVGNNYTHNVRYALSAY